MLTTFSAMIDAVRMEKEALLATVCWAIVNISYQTHAPLLSYDANVKKCNNLNGSLR